MAAEAQIIDVAAGLWIWRMQHPDWRADLGWHKIVTSTCVLAGADVFVLDPVAPEDGDEVWTRLDEQPPTGVIVLKPDHIRDTDLFVRRYGTRAYGPFLFWRTDIPETDLEPIEPGMELPGGLVTLYDGRGRMETPLWLPEQRALVFADGMTGQGDGKLRVWTTRWHEKWVLPAFRAMLELPFEHVIVSHGEPVHDRVEFEKALGREPWRG